MYIQSFNLNSLSAKDVCINESKKSLKFCFNCKCIPFYRCFIAFNDFIVNFLFTFLSWTLFIISGVIPSNDGERKKILLNYILN